MSHKLQIEISTRYPLPIGEQIFLSGNVPSLGNWKPAGLPLTRIDDLVWIGETMIPDDVRVEYKITRGSWDSEACDPDGRIPVNAVLPNKGTAIQQMVLHWSDQRINQPMIDGDFRVHEQVSSEHLRHDRNVIVWLPPSYANTTSRRYPVLYMHDGEQIFDPTTSTWGQDWEVDEWCMKLIAERRLQEIIVVGIYSTPDRFIEYNPSQMGPAYARFLLEELKPFIDQEYRTLPSGSHTAVAGASMGGGISFYLAWEHPGQFFGAACLSSVFEYGEDRFMLDRVRDTKLPEHQKWYLYCGGGDDLEKRLTGDLHAMVKTLNSKGLASTDPRLLVVEDPNGLHNEATWALHTDHWLLHLFGRE